MVKKIKEIFLEVILLIINCICVFYKKFLNELYININKIFNNKFLECVVKCLIYNYV